MTIEISIALLAGSSVITAGILKMVPQRESQLNGKYLRKEEYNRDQEHVIRHLERFDEKLDDLQRLIIERL